MLTPCYRSFVRLAVLAALAALWTRAAGAQQDCVGDCDGDRRVAINELILGVDIVLGMRPPSACALLENAAGVVDVAQLLAAVNNA